MRLENYEVRLRPDRVEALRAMARREAFERGAGCSWVELLRRGADLVLEGRGSAAAEAATTAVTAGRLA